MLWEPDDTGALICIVHKKRFGKGASCSECASTAARFGFSGASDEPKLTAPAGCLTSVELEARFVQVAWLLEEAAMGMIVDPEKASTGVKLFDTALKALRAAGEFCQRREQEAAIERLTANLKRVRRPRGVAS